MAEQKHEFIGIAIGGYSDGQELTCRSREITVHIPSTPSAVYTPAILDQRAVRYDREVYMYFEMYSVVPTTGYVPHGFWVPRDKFLDAHLYIMNALIERYKEPKE